MTASPIPAPQAGDVPVSAEPLEEEPPSRKRRKVLLLLLLLAVLVALLLLALWYLLFRQPLPLPQPPGEVIMPTYATAYYGSDRPMGVAVTPDGGRIYVGATAGDTTAKVFDAQGGLLAEMQPPLSTGGSHAPVYLARHPVSGEVYVSDRPTGSIYVYDADGTYVRTFTTDGAPNTFQPLGLAFDPAGNLYVSDVGSSPQRVIEFDATGKAIRTLGESAGMSFPNGIAVDAAGNVYVTDSNNGRLLVFDPSGEVAATIGRGTSQGNLGLPRGLALDEQGRVYVADSSGQAVFVYDQLAAGEQRLNYLGTFGAAGVANGEFQYPNGIASDGRGRLYVTDSGNDRVQVWSY
jgi:DNA-binding beta-propeller fold protein YncE